MKISYRFSLLDLFLNGLIDEDGLELEATERWEAWKGEKLPTRAEVYVEHSSEDEGEDELVVTIKF